MNTDVTLDGGTDGTFVVVDSRVLMATASDFMLARPERIKGGQPFRRALVHDQGDGLTINFGGDYGGGVTVVDVAELIPQRHERPLGELPDQLPTLVVRGGISYEEPGVTIDGKPATITVSISAVLSELQTQIATLAERVATLEKHP